MCVCVCVDVPDIVQKEFVNQLFPEEAGKPRGPPSLLNFLPNPPPIPPPPEIYRAEGQKAISGPPSLSPTSLRASECKINRHFMLPPSPEPDDYSEGDEDIQVPEFPREQFQIIEKLGDGQFGVLDLCEVQWRLNFANSERSQLVVVCTLRDEKTRTDFDKEVRALAKIKDTNVARLLSASPKGESFFVREYCELGDLCQFLQDHVAETATPLASAASSLR